MVVRGSAAGFAQEILAGRHPLTADEPVAAGGADTGPTPYGLLLAAFAASDHVESFRGCIETRRVCARQSCNVSFFGIILPAKDPEKTFVAVSHEKSIGFGKIKDGVRRAESSDALDAVICLQIKDLNRLVVLARKKEPAANFVHCKMKMCQFF